ncbi:MAG: ABC transporter permease subunit [Chitinophagaceae bacterium]
MFHLLKIEWLKIKYYRTFWILSVLFLISIFGINYISYYVQGQVQNQVPKGNVAASAILGASPFQFPAVWQTVAYMSGFLLFIPGLLIIISITNEFSYKTHRQNIIDGLSRTQFIVVKMLLVVIIALLSTLAVFITAFFFGIAEGSAAISFANIQYIAYFFVQTLSYTSLGLLFGLLFKRSGIAIGVFFLYVVVLEHMLGAILNHYTDNAGNFLPLSSSVTLIPFPFLRNVVNQFFKPPDALYLLIASAIYLVIYYFACKRKFEIDDL